jgi:chromosome segregation ATPase
VARAGITYVDVVKAAETIQASGQEPTVDRVREQLKTGSKSTIAPLLKRWRSEESVIQSDYGLPSDLLEVVKSLYERLQQMANVRIEEAQQEFRAAKDQLLKDQAESQNKISQLTSLQQDLVQQNQHLTQEKLFLSKSLEEARINLARVESQRNSSVTRIEELTAVVGELKQENRDIRNHFEHYQQRTAEDRHQEREQFRTSQRQLQDQVDFQARQLDHAEALNFELKRDLKQQQTKFDDVLLEKQALKTELIEKIAEIHRLGLEVSAAVSTNQDLNKTVIALRAEIEKQSDRAVTSDRRVTLLAHQVEIAEKSLVASADQIAKLTDENKILIQEKGMLDGQIKQLQRSLPKE